MKVTFLFCFLISLSIASGIMAKDDRNGFFIGGSAGSANFGSEADYESQLTKEFESEDYSVDTMETEIKSSYNKIFLGYRFFNYFGLEYAFGGLGSISTTSNIQVLGTGAEVILENELTYTTLSANFYLPLNRFDLIAKFGSISILNKYSTQTTLALAGSSTDTKESVESGSSLFYALGAQVHFGIVSLFVLMDQATMPIQDSTIPISILNFGLSLNF